MDGQQPGNIYTPGQSKDEQSETADTGVTEEIAQIKSAVESEPPTEIPQTEIANADSQPETPDYTIGQPREPQPQRNDNDSDVKDPVLTLNRDTIPDDPSGRPQQDEGEEGLLLSWQSAGDKQTRGPRWYGALSAVALLLATLTVVVTGSWMSAAVIILAVITVMVVNTKGPEVQAYGIFEGGVQIEERFYSFGQLRSFSLSTQNGEAVIELEPSKRFYPRITMHAGDFIDPAQDVLGQFLPRNDREPDLIDKISQRLKL